MTDLPLDAFGDPLSDSRFIKFLVSNDTGDILCYIPAMLAEWGLSVKFKAVWLRCQEYVYVSTWVKAALGASDSQGNESLGETH
jgi:hypothetical protein